jgi:nuclear pore complex protein Nup133
MNDVAGEDDYESAAACLENLAIGSEKQLWNHHVEISLAKLSKLASREKNPSLGNTSAFQEDIDRLDDSIAIDETQHKLYHYIRQFTDGAIDHKAEQELALDYFGSYLAQDRPSLHEILGDALSTLVNRSLIGTDGLLDVLTLIGYVEVPEDVDSDICSREFYQALRVLDHSRDAQRDPSYVSALRKLIWRRCMIKDNWNALGKAAEGTNGDSDSATRDTAIYQTLLTCLRGKFKMNLHSNTSHSNILSIEHSDMSLQSLFQPVSPAEALMADSESDILVSRFRPEQRARVATDLQREDDLLRDYIETGKLDFWFQNLLESIGSQTAPQPDTPAGNAGVQASSPSQDSKARLTFV